MRRRQAGFFVVVATAPALQHRSDGEERLLNEVHFVLSQAALKRRVNTMAVRHQRTTAVIFKFPLTGLQRGFVFWILNES